jgi:decaprenylphospho-beta-D-ribofuranose 2-oxidase
VTLSGWGRVPVVAGRERRSEHLDAITRDMPLTRGLGRAYGDAALPGPADTVVAGSTLADRILSFDPATGILRAEAGLSLDQIYRVFLPRGFFTPVTPGTRFVTLGGMVAADVHGKNHHVDGCFGEHVLELTLRIADGPIVTCSRESRPELFFATIGGMGLTGHILDVTVRLAQVPSPWIYQDRQAIANVDRFVDALKTASAAWPMTAGWIDCLATGAAMGRGILFSGRWAEPDEAPAPFPHLRRPIDVPLTAPAALLQRTTVRLFNAAYFQAQRRRPRRSVVAPAAFFYPLDGVGSWNRLYGTRGLIQYQCVVPDSGGYAGIRAVLHEVARRGVAFLGVIKDCGAEGHGLLSFPRPGTSLAIDMPMRADTQQIVDTLNEIVIAAGGRIYLAKDALTRAEHFRAMEPRLDDFLRVRRQWDPDGRIRSAQSVRLFGW